MPDDKPEIKVWTDYQTDRDSKEHTDPILCPVIIEMIKKQEDNDVFFEFKMDRMRAQEISSLKKRIILSVAPALRPKTVEMLDDYIDYFKAQDEPDLAVLPGPLDIHDVKRSVIYLIYLKNVNWAFSGHKQFTVLNDDPHNSMVRQLSSFDGNNGILVHRAAPIEKRMKYDYHVTIYQSDGKATDIIIDPGDNESPGGGSNFGG